MNCVKRIALMVIRNILLVPFMWCKLCYYAAHVDKYPEITRYKLLKYIVKRANKGGNVTIEAYGKENIPKEGGFMFFPNHQGLYDVLAIVDACPRPFSVVAKKEVANASDHGCYRGSKERKKLSDLCRRNPLEDGEQAS